jgi:hypothetical protein
LGVQADRDAMARVPRTAYQAASPGQPAREYGEEQQRLVAADEAAA